jgi:pyruvate dehydrogenase E1 component beta subunit
MFWHMGLMMDRGPVPEEDYIVPLGEANVVREGNDVTVLANGLMLKYALEVAKNLEGEIDLEIVDPRSFRPFDLDTVLKSLEKTGHLVVVDEDFYSCGWAADVAAQVVEHGFDLLDAPILRVAIDDVPIPGGVLEPVICPSPEKIEAAIRRVFA